jgi:hypothetical protein
MRAEGRSKKAKVSAEAVYFCILTSNFCFVYER